MSFSKKIKLYMRSSICNIDTEGGKDGSTEFSENEYSADLSFNSDGALARFTEDTEGGVILSEISLSQNRISVKKSGAINSYMVFCAGEEFKSVYSIPPFSFDMRIFTKALKCSVSENGGEAKVLYRMEIGGAEKSCSMKLILSESEGSGV